MLSSIRQGAAVSFPVFTGERVYMRQFERGQALPLDLARWQATVDAMLVGIESRGPVFLMVDQAYVRRRDVHRRPGLHVDNYWLTYDHGGPPPRPYPSRHGDPLPPSPGHGGHGQYAGYREAVIIASTDLGCQALVGEWNGEKDDHGDCSHVKRDRLQVVPMLPGVAWVGETGALLHEALPVGQECLRTVVRLNVTNWAA